MELDTERPLVVSRYPRPLPALRNEQVEKDFALLQQITVAVRDVRNKHNVPPARRLTVSVKADGAAAAVDPDPH